MKQKIWCPLREEKFTALVRNWLILLQTDIDNSSVENVLEMEDHALTTEKGHAQNSKFRTYASELVHDCVIR